MDIKDKIKETIIQELKNVDDAIELLTINFTKYNNIYLVDIIINNVNSITCLSGLYSDKGNSIYPISNFARINHFKKSFLILIYLDGTNILLKIMDENLQKSIMKRVLIRDYNQELAKLGLLIITDGTYKYLYNYELDKVVAGPFYEIKLINIERGFKVTYQVSYDENIYTLLTGFMDLNGNIIGNTLIDEFLKEPVSLLNGDIEKTLLTKEKDIKKMQKKIIVFPINRNN